MSKGLGISPLEVYKMPVSMVKDFLTIHSEAERLQAEEIEKAQKKAGAMRNG